MYGVFVRLVVVVGVLLAVGLPGLVGLDRLRQVRSSWRERLRRGGPALLLLLVVLGINSLARQALPDISWLVGIEITDTIYQLEGTVVASVQSVEHPALTAYFSSVYVYGYVFLLVFPVLAYVTLDRLDSFRGLVWAYLFNYALGLVCYTLFIAYGPRNALPGLVEPLLYNPTPEYQMLTREVNHNTNVFPSLHTSLSVTALVFAYRTRDVYGRWLPVAALLAASIVVSTMYLGLHWATDVVFGIVLAWVSVRLADRVVERDDPGLRARLPTSLPDRLSN
jgi:membrane-associated phospholipid phosphatase